MGAWANSRDDKQKELKGGKQTLVLTIKNIA